MRVAVQGIGWVTPGGIGPGKAKETFKLCPGRLPKLKSKRFLNEAHPRFGRFDNYAKAGFGAIALALRQAGLHQWDRKRPIGLVVSTQRGCLETDIAYFQTAAHDGGAMASPNLFAYTLPNCMLGEASIQFGLAGPSFVISDLSDRRLSGVHTALNLLQWELCRTTVAGGCDVDVKGYGQPAAEPCGAVFFVLTRTEARTGWQWDNQQLTCQDTPVGDLERMAHLVLAG